MPKKLLQLRNAERQIERRIRKTEKRAYAVGESVISGKRFGRFIRILGPGLVTGAADDDPSGIATYSQAGAQFGYGLLWAFPIMYPLLLFVQESCARIGAITGRGLAAILKDNYSKPLLYFSVFLVVIANTINIGADLGAMAATTQLFIDLPFGLLAIAYACLIVLLVIFVRYKTYAKILKWLAVALLAYPITAFLIKQDWQMVAKNTFNFMPSVNFDTLYILVGMLGTTISPYLFFWDTSEQVEEEVERHNLAKIGEQPKATKKFLHKMRVDNFIGMTLASLTAWFIVIVCGATLNAAGITQIETAADAARALEPLVQNFPNAGLVAKMIFSVGIIGLGLLAVPVLAGSASYAITETLGWKEGLYRKFKRASGFYGVIVLATIAGLGINFLGIDPIKALVFTAVFNGVAAVPLLVMIVRVGRNRKIMGDYRNGLISTSVIWSAIIIMTVAVIMLFIGIFTHKL